VFYEDIKKLIQFKALEIKNDVISFRRHIHKYPELSFNERETSSFICSVLDKYNIKHKSGISGHGVVAVIECNNPNSKVLGLRADMDALPIKEENNVPYRSVNEGIMHACGHDVHSAVALGVCIVLNEIKDKLNGTIKIIFQPAEEKLPGGAIQMINDGVLNYPKVEKLLALHVMPEMESGNVGFRSGKYMAACDEIYIKVNGKGGHAALPDQVINPIIVAANLMINIKKSVSLIDSDDKYVLEFGDFHAFGASNVIPNHANISGTFRSLNQKFRSEVHELIFKEAKLIDLNYKSNCVVKIKKGYPVLFNDNDLTKYCEKYSKLFLGENKVHELEIRMASEDFSYFSNEVPSCFFRLGVGNKKKNITSSVHSPTFNIDENSIEIGVGLMSFLLCTNLQDQKKV
tara:strand:- start:1606 stop:2814 length:1209 start_codon:yes stop_codon:yes gene_type:complete